MLFTPSLSFFFVLFQFDLLNKEALCWLTASAYGGHEAVKQVFAIFSC